MSYILGLDGGGTKTRAVILQGEEERGRAQTGGINYNSSTKEQIRAHLKELGEECEKAGFAPGECAGIGLGAAGVSNPEAVSFLKEALRECGFLCPVFVFGDHEAALRGGLLKEAGILLVAGTGSICLAQNAAGEKKRVGGYGHLIDDGGSAYDIGRRILSAAVQSFDGRRERTELTEALYERLKIRSVQELVSYVYRPETGKKEIAQLAMLLTAERMERDRASREIAHSAAASLGSLVWTAAAWMEETSEKEGETWPLLLTGSVLENNGMICVFLEEWMEEKGLRVRVAKKSRDAAYGAASLFLDKAGWQLS